MTFVVQVFDSRTGDMIAEKRYLTREEATAAAKVLVKKLGEKGYELIQQNDEELILEKGGSQITILVFEVISA